jgi:acyl-coenzyme A thioesterase PaaI-like protein
MMKSNIADIKLSPLAVRYGLKYTEFSPSLRQLSASLIVSPGVEQPFALLHGGINAAIAEEVSAALAKLLSTTQPSTNPTNNANNPSNGNNLNNSSASQQFLPIRVSALHLGSAVAGEELLILCNPIQLGKTMQVFTVKIDKIKSAKGETLRKPQAVAAAQVTLLLSVPISSSRSNQANQANLSEISYETYLPQFASSQPEDLMHLRSPLWQSFNLDFNENFSSEPFQTKVKMKLTAQHIEYLKLTYSSGVNLGILGFLAEELGSMLTLKNAGGKLIVGTSITMDRKQLSHGRIEPGDELVAVSSPISMDSKTHVWDTDVSIISHRNKQVYSVGIVRLNTFVLEKPFIPKQNRKSSDSSSNNRINNTNNNNNINKSQLKSQL